MFFKFVGCWFYLMVDCKVNFWIGILGRKYCFGFVNDGVGVFYFCNDLCDGFRLCS